ncbi:MAG: glycine oxidase ThiO [Gammaproteobacteria bacterium]
MKNHDVIVVGAGVIGLFTALELRQSGLDVCLIDTAMAAHSASWAGGGILSPLRPWQEPPAIHCLADWSRTAYRELVPALEQTTGINVGLQAQGLLWLDLVDETAALDWLVGHGRIGNKLDQSGLAVLEPNLNVAATGHGLSNPDIEQIRNPRLIRALQAAARIAGVDLKSANAPAELIIDGARCPGIRVADEQVLAINTVVCSGAWASKLLAEDEITASLYPVRGQMIAYQLPEPPCKHIVFQHGHYLIPRNDGVLLAGSTVEEVGFDDQTTAQASGELQAFAQRLLPGLTNREPDWHWAGLRPATTDELPLIGPHPRIAGLYLNTGHFRNGILLAPASARLLADQFLGREAFCPAQPYLPARFMT